MLRHAIPIGIQYTRVRLIPALAQCLHDSEEHGAVVPPGHVGHVLQEHDRRPKVFDDLDEAAPQLRAPIGRLPLAGRNKAAELRATSARERLAGRTSGYDIRPSKSASRHEVDEPRSVSEIATERERPQIRLVRLQSRGIRVSGRDDGESGTREAEAEPSSPAEEIDRPRPGLPLQPPSCGGRISGRACDASGRFKNVAALIGKRERIVSPPPRGPCSCH